MLPPEGPKSDPHGVVADDKAPPVPVDPSKLLPGPDNGLDPLVPKRDRSSYWEYTALSSYGRAQRY